MYQRYTTNTDRSSTEQLLVSESVERAVAAVDIPDVAGRKVAVEVVSVDRGAEFYDDRPYVQSAIEHRLRRAGAVIVPAEAADLIVLARVGAVGTVSRQLALGIPNLNINFYTSAKHHGYTKLRLVTTDPASGAMVAQSEPVMKSSRHDYWSLLQFIVWHQDIYPDVHAVDID